MSTLGLVAILKGDLAPAWYGVALLVLALPYGMDRRQNIYDRQEEYGRDIIATEEQP